MCLAVSVMPATGSTMVRTKYRLEKYTMARMARPTPREAATMSTICRSTIRREVTYRMAPTTSPLTIKGLVAAMMCSPVLGSLPDQVRVRPRLRAWSISGVPGERKAVRSELEKRIWPLASRNSTSSRSPEGSPDTMERA